MTADDADGQGFQEEKSSKETLVRAAVDQRGTQANVPESEKVVKEETEEEISDVDRRGTRADASESEDEGSEETEEDIIGGEADCMVVQDDGDTSSSSDDSADGEEAASRIAALLHGSSRDEIVKCVSAFVRNFEESAPPPRKKQKRCPPHTSAEAAERLEDALPEVRSEKLAESLGPMARSLAASLAARSAAEESVWRLEAIKERDSKSGPMMQVLEAARKSVAKCDFAALQLARQMRDEFLKMGRALQDADRNDDALAFCVGYAEALAGLGGMVSAKGFDAPKAKATVEKARQELLALGRDINLLFEAVGPDNVGSLVDWPALKSGV